MKEQKNKIIRMILITMVLIAIFFVTWRLTGNQIVEINSNDNSVIDVIRSPPVNNSNFLIKDVNLSITSSQNIIAIEEVLIGNNCSILGYSVTPKVDIVEFTPELNLWIIGNRSDSLSINLTYYIPDNCSVDEFKGKVYVLENDETITDETIESDTTISPTGGGGETPGGSSSSNLAFQNVSSKPIIQAKDDADYRNLISNAVERLAGITDESHELKKENFYPFLILIILLILIAGITIFFIFLKKPKEFKHKQKGNVGILVEYLKKFKGKYSTQELKKKVLSAGYSEKDFNTALER